MLDQKENSTIVDRVTLVDDAKAIDNVVTLENTTEFNKEGQIVGYDSKEIECYSDHCSSVQVQGVREDIDEDLSDQFDEEEDEELDFGDEDVEDVWEYKGFTVSNDIRDFENPTVPFFSAFKDGHPALPIMTVEEYNSLSEEDKEDTMLDKIKEVVDGYLESIKVKKEHHITPAVEKVVPTMEEALTDLGESINSDVKDEPFTVEDIKESFKDSMFNSDDKYNLPDEDILVLLDIVEKVKRKENINIFSAFPQSVKDLINKYMLEQGVQGYSVQSNSIRNMLSNSLIDEFITNISINKSVDSFNKEMEDLFIKTGEEFSKMYKEYDSERTKYLEAALEKIPEGDPKRETITKVLDSINDAYKLTRLREATSHLKIKNFDREKPERIFSDFEYKYKDKPYKIYPIKQVIGVLHKHLIEAVKETLPEELSDEDKLARADIVASIESVDFMILFCKFCMNYKVEIPEEHAFMYYTLYNIMLLDVYKGDEYTDFANGLINNIIESYKPYYKKKMTEENFKKRFG